MFADFNLPETSEVQGIQRILEKYKQFTKLTFNISTKMKAGEL